MHRDVVFGENPSVSQRLQQHMERQRLFVLLPVLFCGFFNICFQLVCFVLGFHHCFHKNPVRISTSLERFFGMFLFLFLLSSWGHVRPDGVEFWQKVSAPAGGESPLKCLSQAPQTSCQLVDPVRIKIIKLCFGCTKTYLQQVRYLLLTLHRTKLLKIRSIHFSDVFVCLMMF